MAKQLSLSDRIFIENSIHRNYTFASIARQLGRSPSTISREVKRYRVFVDKPRKKGENDCIRFRTCVRNNLCEEAPTHGCYFYRCKSCPERFCIPLCPAYVSSHCEKLDKPPYVCFGCSKQKTCKKNHAYYTAHRANTEHKRNMKESHQGIRKTPEEILQIAEIISPLILRGQSLNHICATHGSELGISERTLYNYIDSSVFKVRNIDLPKKVAYRQRKPPKVYTKVEYKYRRGRSYADFESYMEANPGKHVVEMDTVKSTRGCNRVFLTLIFTDTDFMLIFLLKNGKQESVLDVFDNLTQLLGVDLFRKLFPVILTDNGVEFKDPERLEHTNNGCQRTRIFYCDPQASWQKPHVEKNHTLIRRILPKGTSFSKLTKEDVNLVTCHINSVIREQFSNQTPFDLMTSADRKKLLSLLNLAPVPPDEVYLKPALLKR
ncbi:MAG: IS30 family transposase [Firmicutes bacterium]|nr:IS30 family transposase [Bacillota bacterium]